MTDSRNRIIVVDGLFRSAMLEVMDRLAADHPDARRYSLEDLQRLANSRPEIPVDQPIYKEERREKVRDWEDRGRPRHRRRKKRR